MKAWENDDYPLPVNQPVTLVVYESEKHVLYDTHGQMRELRQPIGFRGGNHHAAPNRKIQSRVQRQRRG